jgi:hypothetical protein
MNNVPDVPQTPINEFDIAQQFANRQPNKITGQVINEKGKVIYGYINPADGLFYPFIHNTTQELLRAVEILNPTVLYNVPSPAPPAPSLPPPRRPKMYD